MKVAGGNWGHWLLPWLGVVTLAHAAPLVAPTAPAAAPLIQSVTAEDHDDHTDVLVLMNCSARYIAMTPFSHGADTTITLRLGPDCGSLQRTFPSELPPVGGGSAWVSSARLDSTVPGEVALQLTWTHPLDFVLAPSADGTELHLRLLGHPQPKPRVLLRTDEAPEGYAVNLDAARSPFGRDALQAAAALLQTQVYESQIDIDDERWFRLRAGPFATRQQADRALQRALQRYPRAWLAVNDDQSQDLAAAEETEAASPEEPAATDAPLPPAERERLLSVARVALARHQYPQALDPLMRLLRQPEYPGRADAQELIGLVRERAGELALAKAEFREYLRRYPHGPGVERVQARLRALLAGAQEARSMGEPAAAASQWTLTGSAAVNYQFENDRSQAGGSTNANTSDSAALVYGDVLLRERGSRYDFTTRVDAGYTKVIGVPDFGAQDRTTAAYLEVTDHLLELTGRVGRQSLATLGAIGLFDGIFVGYQASPHISVSAAAGLPAYTGYSSLSGSTKFGTLTAEFDPFDKAWIFDTYFFDQLVGSETDRRSVGFQVRHGTPGQNVVLLVDYDVAFQQLNAATLIGNLRLGQSWVLGFDADHRRSPLLELDNALIGQNATDLSVLGETFTPSQIRQLALDRTATSDTLVLSASRPFGDRWNLMIDVAGLQLSSTPASGGVPATASTGLDKSGTVQLSGASILQADDLQILGMRYDDSPLSRSETVSWDARFAIAGAWRIGPRLSVERLDQPTLGGRQLLYLPQVRADWTGRTQVIEFTAGYQVLQQSLNGEGTVAGLQQRSLYVSVAYRVRF